MSNKPQMLVQVTGGGSLQPSRAKAPAYSPTMAIEQPSISFPGHCIRAVIKGGWIFKNARATETKTVDKISLSGGGTDRDNFMKLSDVEVDDVYLDWDKIIPADKLAEFKAYMKMVATDGAPRRATITIRKGNMVLGYRFKKFHKKPQVTKFYFDENFFEISEPSLTSLPQGGHGYPSPGPHGSLPPHYSADKLLDCRLRSTHYTISQDHTSGEEAHQDNLLAGFGKRRRTDKPPIPLGGSKLLQCSPNLLPRLGNGNYVVAQNEGSDMEVTEADFNRFDDPETLHLGMLEYAVSLPKESATTKPNEGKSKGVRSRLSGFRDAALDHDHLQFRIT